MTHPDATSDQLARVVLEQATDVVYWFDTQGVLRAVNPAITTLLGYRPDEVLDTRRVFEAVHPEDMAVAQSHFRAKLTGQEQESRYTIRLQRKDGALVWCELASRARIEGGKVVGVQGILRDVSERIRHAQALEARERRLQALVGAVHDAIIAAGPDGRITLFNAGAERMFGWSAKEAVGRPLTDLMPERLRPGHARGFARVAGGGPSTMLGQTVEQVGRRADGSEFPLELSLASWSEDGKPAFVAVLRDISARNAHERALAASEARLQELWDNASDILYTHDLSGRFTDVNAAAVAVYGYSRDEFLQRNIRDVVDTADPIHLAKAQENLQIKLAGGKERTRPYELLTRAKNGKPIWVEVSTRLVREDGQPKAIHGVVRNISRRKAEEARLHFVQQLALDLAQAKDFTKALQVTLDRVCTAAGWAYGEAWVPDADGLMVCSPAWHAGKPGLEKFRHLSKGMRFGRDEGLAGQLWRNRRAMWREDLRHEEGLRRATAAEAAGLRTLLAVPVVDGERTVADLVFLHTEWRPEEDPRWAAVLDAVATQLGAILALQRREDLLRRQARLFAAQLRANPVPALATDAQGHILWANERFLELAGVAFRPEVRFAIDNVRFVELVNEPERLMDVAARLCEGPANGIQVGGRRFDRHDAILGDGEQSLGRVRYFFDVTERDVARSKARPN